jgi:signal transduction histidine kinase
MGISEKILKFSGIDNVYSYSAKKFIILNFSLIILLAFLATLGMIILSHKVAGPAYRIRKMLKELQEGKYPEFKLRKGDTLTSIVEELEKFSNQYKELVDSAMNVIEIWKNTEVKDISLNIALKELENKMSHISFKKKEVEDEKRI